MNTCFFTETNRKPNMICFQDMVSDVRNGKWYVDKKTNIHDKMVWITTTAEKLISSDLCQCS